MVFTQQNPPTQKSDPKQSKVLRYLAARSSDAITDEQSFRGLLCNKPEEIFSFSGVVEHCHLSEIMIYFVR